MKSGMKTAGVWQKNRDLLPQIISLSSPFSSSFLKGLQANKAKRKPQWKLKNKEEQKFKSLSYRWVSGHVCPAKIRDGWLSMWIRPSCVGWPTSHLLLQAQYDLDSLLQDDKLGLGLVALQVDLTHPAQLSEGFVNVAHTHPLPSVVSQAALALPLLLLLGSQVLISHWDNAAARRRSGWLEGLVSKPKSQPLQHLGLMVSLNLQL